jgi:hypothetical protein
MVHGPSGGGKTFVVLDWCLRMASGSPDWAGYKVKAGNVVYLAGEGHHGLKSRIAAWKNHNTQDRLNMWLSKDGCDLNTPTGYLKVVSNLRAILRSSPILTSLSLVSWYTHLRQSITFLTLSKSNSSNRSST